MNEINKIIVDQNATEQCYNLDMGKDIKCDTNRETMKDKLDNNTKVKLPIFLNFPKYK